MIIVGFNLFRNSFSMISRVLKYFIKFYRNIIAYGVSHSIRTQTHFRSSQLFGWSEATTELLLSCFCFREQAGWSESCVLIGYASGIELMQGIKIYKATKTENLPEASESRSSWKGFRQIITLDMIVYGSDLDLRSQISPLLVWTMFDDESYLYFECWELGYECSTILKIPRNPRISIVLSRCKKKEKPKVRLLNFLNLFR